MSHRRTSGRGSGRPPPDPRDELPAGGEVAPQHRPRREARPCDGAPSGASAAHETRAPAVDEALRVAQLGGRHPVEVAIPSPSPANRRRRDRLALVGPRRRRRRARQASARRVVGPISRRSAPAFGDRRPAASSSRSRRLAARTFAAGIVGEARPAAPPAVERDVVDLAIVAPADEHGGPGRAHLLAVADVDQVSARAKSSAAPRSTGGPRPSAPGRTRPPRQEAPAVDRLAVRADETA